MEQTAAAHGLHVELPPAPLLPQNQPSSELPRPSLVLPNPSTAAPSRWNAAAAAQCRRRPPAHVEPLPRTSSPRTKDTQRCDSVPLSLFPNFSPTAGASPRRKPGQNSSSVLQCPPGTSGWNSKKPRGLSANPKTQWNSAIGTCLL